MEPGLFVELGAHGFAGGFEAAPGRAGQGECDLCDADGMCHEPEAAVDGLESIHGADEEVGIDEQWRRVEGDDEICKHEVEVGGVLE